MASTSAKRLKTSGRKSRHQATLQFLAKLKGRTLITGHSLMDLDGAASALAVAATVDKISSSTAFVRTIDTLNSSAKHALTRAGLTVPVLNFASDLHAFHNIIFVDVSSYAQLSPILGELKKFKGKVIVIDHHENNSQPIKATHTLYSPQPACAVIAYQLAKTASVPLGKPAARLLAAACVSDTARFKSATPELFETLHDLLHEYHIPYTDVLDDATTTPNVAERAERITAVQNATLKRLERPATSKKRGEAPEVLLVAVGNARAFELHVAASLVQLGADYAFVANPKTGRVEGVRLETLPSKYPGIGDILAEVSKTIGGNGGGHPNAGGWTGKPNDVPAALDACVQAVQDAMR